MIDQVESSADAVHDVAEEVRETLHNQDGDDKEDEDGLLGKVKQVGAAVKDKIHDAAVAAKDTVVDIAKAVEEFDEDEFFKTAD